MADIIISAVGTAYSGTNDSDDFRNSAENLRDITVAGKAGDDILLIGSAPGGGLGIGFSIGSSELTMGSGDDTVTFSGQAGGTGAAQFKSTNIKLGSGSDFTRLVGFASASASTVRGNDGDDQIIFNNLSGGGTTAHDVRVNGNAGDDAITFNWSGTEANGVGVLGGGGVDTITATFNTVISGFGSATLNTTGVKVGGNKGDDLIVVNLNSTADEVRVNGNSGADTITVTAAADVTEFRALGGKGNDLITAAFAGGNSADGVTVNGNLGNDTVNAKFSGGHLSALSFGGGSGDDSLIFSNQSVVLTAGSGNHILGGTGADTITVNLGGNLVATGASGFVADLGGGAGGTIDLNLSATMSARSGGGIFFRGSSAADSIDVTNATGGGGLSTVAFSGQSGADTITFNVHSGGSYSATTFVGGSGADVITAEVAADSNGGLFGIASAGQVRFEGGVGNDTMVLKVEQGGGISAGLFDGGAGNDSITVSLLSGGSASVVGSGTELVGGSGADTIAFSIGSFATTAGAVVRAGSGADVITGTIGSGGTFLGGEFTAAGGDGADTIAFTFSAAATAGITIRGVQLAGTFNGSGGTFDGGAGADSITILGEAVTGGTFSFGEVKGGAGADTITVGGLFGGSGGETVQFTGVVDGGAGADSIVFSGNNAYSGGIASFVGGGAAGTGGFQFASGDSQIDGFDTIFVSNNDVTGGRTTLQGTFGSAGFNFSGMNAGTFTMATDSSLDSAGNATTLGQAIFRDIGNSAGEVGSIGAMTGGVIGAYSAGAGAITAGNGGTFVLSGGSTITQIFSAVDAATQGRGTVSVFNVQDGSAGTVDGYMFVQGGLFTDMVVKFDGNDNTAGQFGVNDGYFSAGGADGGGGLVQAIDNSDGSGGQVYFGANVGIG